MGLLENQVTCFNCQSSVSLEPNAHVPRNEECPKCYANIHSCRMCSFYDPSSYNECREPMANRILEKEKANFCEFFKLVGGAGAKDEKEDLLSKANSLFKD